MKCNAPVIVAVAAIVALFALLLAMPSDGGLMGDGEGEENRQELYAEETGEEGPVPDENPEMSIDIGNGTYRSKERVDVVISVSAPEEIPRAHIDFKGIRNKYGAYTIEKGFDMNMTEGENMIETGFNVPSCYGCSGIEPGNYSLRAVLSDENGTQITNATTPIEVLE